MNKIEIRETVSWPTRVVAIGIFGLVVSLTLLGSVTSRPVGAAEAGEPESTDDYDAYPLAFVPDGCTAQGADILIGERFTSTTDPRWVDNFRKLNPGIKDTVTMTWDSVAPGCEEGRIHLSAKLSLFTSFVLKDEQYGAFGTSCGPDGPTCEAVGNTLSIDLAELGVAPCYQLDAHLGPQLETVGPSGDYYGIFNREFNMLIAAKNGGVLPCDETNPILRGEDIRKSTPCPFDSEIPLLSIRCQKSLEDAPASTTTTEALTLLRLPASTTTVPEPVTAKIFAPTTTTGVPKVPSTTSTVPATTVPTKPPVPTTAAEVPPTSTRMTPTSTTVAQKTPAPTLDPTVPPSLPFTDPTSPQVTLPATGDRRAVLGLTGMLFVGSGLVFLRAARARSVDLRLR